MSALGDPAVGPLTGRKQHYEERTVHAAIDSLRSLESLGYQTFGQGLDAGPLATKVQYAATPKSL